MQKVLEEIKNELNIDGLEVKTDESSTKQGKQWRCSVAFRKKNGLYEHSKAIWGKGETKQEAVKDAADWAFFANNKERKDVDTLIFSLFMD